MFELILSMFTYDFILRALIVGVLVALCSALLGVSLVLKRYSMIGDGLSHVGFGALAVAMAMNVAPLAVAVPVVILAAFLLLRVSENSKIKGDSAIALISTSSLALGIMAISLSKGMNSDVYGYMFGSILAMSNSDVVLSIILSVVVLLLFVLFYHKIFAVTFDEDFAKATGVNAGFYNMLIALLTAVTIVLGMRMMGTLRFDYFPGFNCNESLQAILNSDRDCCNYFCILFCGGTHRFLSLCRTYRCQCCYDQCCLFCYLFSYRCIEKQRLTLW